VVDDDVFVTGSAVFVEVVLSDASSVGSAVGSVGVEAELRVLGGEEEASDEETDGSLALTDEVVGSSLLVDVETAAEDEEEEEGVPTGG